MDFCSKLPDRGEDYKVERIAGDCDWILTLTRSLTPSFQICKAGMIGKVRGQKGSACRSAHAIGALQKEGKGSKLELTGCKLHDTCNSIATIRC